MQENTKEEVVSDVENMQAKLFIYRKINLKVLPILKTEGPSGPSIQHSGIPHLPHPCSIPVKSTKEGLVWRTPHQNQLEALE